MDKKLVTILVVEDDDALREAICDALAFADFQTLPTANGKEALAVLHGQHKIDLVLTDVEMPELGGLALLTEIKAQWSEMPVVLMTAFAQVSQAVDAIQNGAADYLVKPFEGDVLIGLMDRLTRRSQSAGGVIAEDARTQALVDMAHRVALSDATVMISGESGSGKEVFAKLIHDHSPRAQGPFVAINCAAIPENMLEAVLFGYEKGAYTGAVNASAGKFEQANGGTILLDEISEMDLGLQAKLLRVLQERVVERLGSSRSTKLDVRVLATTNRNLKEEVEAHRFREDLFYRLNVFPLYLPALRERPGDVAPLAQHFLQQYSAGQDVSFSAGALLKLSEHQWPGNVRELENVVQRTLILRNGLVIDEDVISFEASNGNPEATTAAEAAPIATPAPALDSGLKAREQAMILDALKAERGSRKDTAERLGISPRTLRYKLARFKEMGIALPA
ncbi:MAG: sigma-54-dependent Fis family transcriptional regulator [Gammaproteobacteria bacterium]|nr:sigma-54-dependent Fis family transcriptional regulator [Gammaproteobacteria bacterium]